MTQPAGKRLVIEANRFDVLAPMWATLTRYPAGSLVIRGGKLYRATATHTSGAGGGSFATALAAGTWVVVKDSLDPTPHHLHLRGTSDGADAYDSTPHITIESHQRPEAGPFGESLRLWNMTPHAKTMISWWGATDPSQPPNEVTNPMRPTVWIGAHYDAQNDEAGVHGHWSVEVPNAAGELTSRFGVDYIDQTTKQPGIDKTHTYVANSDFTHRQGDGAVFRISSGAAGAERTLEFSAHGQVYSESPGYIDPMKRRWWILCNQDAESGGNAGANFVVRRFADNGDLLGTVLFAQRANGRVTFGEASAQAARVSARGTGGGESSFLSAPAAALTAPSSHFQAVASAGSTSDRVMDARVHGDGNPRFMLGVAGNMQWGNGSAAGDVSLSRRTAGVLQIGSSQCFSTGVVATGSRPAAGSVGAGAQIFDSTLNKPIWSTGSAWVDATGATV